VTDKKLYTKDSGGNVVLLASNGGDVTGPASSTNLAIPTFSGTGGKTLLNNSGVTITAGVITATGFNKMAITAPATSSTLAVADGKTLTASNSLTLAGTDSTTMTFPTTSATIARTDAAQTFTGAQTFSTAIAVGSGGTGLTTLTSGYIPYGNGTSAYSSSNTFVFNGTILSVGTTTPPQQTTAGNVALGDTALALNINGYLAVNATADFTINTEALIGAPGGFVGTLNVSNTRADYFPQSRRITYAVCAIGTSLTSSILATQDGSGGGCIFSITMPSNGVIRFTNLGDASAYYSMSFFGSKSIG
jgi:hypothetical protein